VGETKSTDKVESFAGANTPYPVFPQTWYCCGNVLTCSQAHAAKLDTLNFMESRTTQEIEQSTEKLLLDLKAVVHDGEELLSAAANQLSEHGLAAREKLAAALEVAKDTRRRLEERAVASAQATDRIVREYPYQSIGVAFGVGLLIGIVVNRR
jgi:ElaB/YqjD/DUF883 family membrane-anchored ribosome-binding protein